MTLSLEEIDKEIKVLENESKAFKYELYKLAWFMRGSVTVDQIFALEREDREIISKIVLENLEAAKKTGMPIF